VWRGLKAALLRLISGMLRYPGNLFADDAIEGRIRAEQLNNVKRHLSSIMLANACNALVLVFALWPSSQRQLAIAWATTIVMFTIYHGFKNRRLDHELPSYVSSRSITRVVRNALLLGALWASLPLLFFADASAGGQIVIACLCAGMLGGGAFAFASIPPAAITFTGPIVFGSAIAIGRSGEPAYLLVALLMVSYILALLRVVFVHAAQIARRVAEQVRAERRVRRDELTDLPNRLAFHEGLESAFARLDHLHKQFAVLYVDLDDFKNVNDKLGHATGDKLLVQVGHRLRACARDVDLVARLSGDEFAVIVADTMETGVALGVASRIVSALDAAFQIDGIEMFTAACVGIALAPGDGASPDRLLKNADEALYSAKHGKGGAIRLHDPEYKEQARQRRRLERALRHALSRNEFFLVFQPIMALGQGRVTGIEALLRWRHPTLGVKSPSEFITILEETGFIHEIGRWIVCEACKAAICWPKDIRVAVNVSPIQLRHANVFSSVVNALKESGLAPGRLELEITETALISDNDHVLSNLNALRELGIRIALDDFGTEYSSLTYLRKLSPDSIKIDGSFVREVLTDADSASIVKSMIGLSRDLGINVVAEGIETGGQLSFLRSQNCHEVQGYFICAPKSSKEITALLSNGDALRFDAA
jgi:diguanylate cyclase